MPEPLRETTFSVEPAEGRGHQADRRESRARGATSRGQINHDDREATEATKAYHRSSCLEPDRLGARPERLDWGSQPIAFRRYPGAPRIELPFADEKRVEQGPELGREPGPLGLATVARLLEHSLGLAGWKRRAHAGFGLRIVPSAGNLHPLETYVLAPELEVGNGHGAALYHYSPFDHALERRRRLPASAWWSLLAACPEAQIFVGLSAIYWRSAWKYGERAFRLCHLDAGHAVAALDASAALEGQSLCWVDAATSDLGRLLGLGAPTVPGSSSGLGPDSRPGTGSVCGPETEDPVCLLAVQARGARACVGTWRPGPETLSALEDIPLLGEPSRIGEGGHRPWPGLAAVVRATGCRVAPSGSGLAAIASTATTPENAVAHRPWTREVLRRRRSRSEYADRPLVRSDFLAMVGRLAGNAGASPIFPWRDELAVALFVHRVEDVEPGLYVAVEAGGSGQEADTSGLLAALGSTFEWQSTDHGGPGWGLVRLAEGDARRAASHLAGDQPAAGDGAFLALFLGLFDSLHRDGAWAYRRLHWQAGQLGHGLYLEAEARGLGATGLAGFFDEPLAHLLGLSIGERSEGDLRGREGRGGDWRPLYLSAVGHRDAEDPELQDPYAHRGTGADPAPASRGGICWPRAPRAR